MQTPLFIGFGVAGGQPRGYGVEFFLGLRDGGVRSQNGEDREIMILAGGGLFWSGHERSPQLGIGGEVELWLFGHDVNDGLRFAVQENGFSDCGGVTAESFSPEALAEDDYVGAGLHVGRGKGAAVQRRDAEKREEILGDVRAFDAIGFTVAYHLLRRVLIG